MFITVIFIKPKFWMNKINQLMYKLKNDNTVEYYLPIKSNQVLRQVATWMDLDMLSERRHRRGHKRPYIVGINGKRSHMNSHVGNTQTGKSIELWTRLVVVLV